MITNDELALLIRKVAADLADGDKSTAADIVEPLRRWTQPNCHVGRGAEMVNTPEGFRIQLEWCAGQLLNLVDEQHWYALNSWINCANKFTTPGIGK